MARGSGIDGLPVPLPSRYSDSESRRFTAMN